MARARLLKPGFFSNEDLCEIPAFGRLLFIGLWTLADRKGRLDDRPKRIKAELFPYENVPVPTLLDKLEEHGFIQRYEVGDYKLIQILNFEKHQHPHRNEPDSVLPAPGECDSGSVGATPANAGTTSTIGRSASDIVRSAPAEAEANTEANTEAKAEAEADGARSRVALLLPSPEISRQFERCFGRLLSPMELESIKALEDEHPVERIEYALREAAEHNARKLSYVKSVCERRETDGDTDKPRLQTAGRATGRSTGGETDVAGLWQEWSDARDRAIQG